MRLSDAIALGRTLLKPGRTFLSVREDAGCALGMAMVAIGKGHELKEGFVASKRAICETWPWLNSLGRGPIYRPIDKIMHDFDESVWWGRMTLEQLIDWVRAYEPPEEGDLPCAVQTVLETSKMPELTNSR